MSGKVKKPMPSEKVYTVIIAFLERFENAPRIFDESGSLCFGCHFYFYCLRYYAVTAIST